MVHSRLHKDKDDNRKANVRDYGDTSLTKNTVLHSRGIHHKKINTTKTKRQKKKWLHIYTRIQRRNTASNRGDKTTCFKVGVFYLLRGSSTHFNKVANDRLNFGWFPFLNPSVLFKKKKKKKPNHSCVNGALKLSLHGRNSTQFQMRLCIRYYTSTQPSKEKINPHI